MRQYIKTLIGILCTAVILNTIAVHVYPKYTGVSIATTITYYLWFLLGFKQFKFLKLTLRDIAYLMIYTVVFFLITRSVNDFIGIPVYLAFIALLVLIFYRNEVKPMMKFIRR